MWCSPFHSLQKPLISSSPSIQDEKSLFACDECSLFVSENAACVCMLGFWVVFVSSIS